MSQGFMGTGGCFMRGLAKAVVNFLQNEDGPTAVEYAIMLALNVVLCVAAITSMGSSANKSFSNINTAFANVGS
jgi:pilus assembly protein Flp/PilA